MVPDSIVWEDGARKEVYNECADSDVRLELGPIEPILVQVSSHMMVFYSPVFNRMLQSDFKEGMRHHQDFWKQRIAFPHDNIHAMLLMIKNFHHRMDTVNLTLFGPGLWKNLAVVCDKYDCISVVRPTISLCFPFELLPESPTALANLLLAALIMKMQSSLAY